MLVLIGIGTNVGNRVENLKNCIELLNFLENKKFSSIYESAALIPSNSNKSWDLPFLNMAILAETKLLPLELLQQIKKVETVLGRPIIHHKWSPRIIDIDILLMEEEYVSSDLIVPHPELLKRAFTLIPCQEIAPDMKHQPSGKKLKDFKIDLSGLLIIPLPEIKLTDGF